MAGRLLADALGQDERVEAIATCTVVETLRAVAEQHPAIVVLSEVLEDDPKRGFLLSREIRTASATTHVVMLLDGYRSEAVVEAFRAGARGVFSRNESIKELGACITRVSEGEISAKSEHVRLAIEALSNTRCMPEVPAENLESLSKREREVVAALVDGLSNREIGERMKLSPHTVKNYVFRVFEKLGVSSRFEVMAAVRRQHSSQSGRVDFVEAQPRDTAGYLQAAAAAGIPSAQFVLGHMYLDGEMVERDKVQAYKWLLLAEQSNQVFSVASRIARKKLATEMLSRELAEAERLISVWVSAENGPWSKTPRSGVVTKSSSVA